jgi:hypothetical protein
MKKCRFRCRESVLRKNTRVYAPIGGFGAERKVYWAIHPKNTAAQKPLYSGHKCAVLRNTPRPTGPHPRSPVGGVLYCVLP